MFEHSVEDHLVMGLSDLKSGAKYSLIAYLLSLLIVAAAFMMFPSLLGGGMRVPSTNLTALISLGIFLLLVGIAILVVVIVALYKFYRATGHLREFDPRLGLGRTGILLVILGIVVLLLGTSIAGLSIGLTAPRMGPSAILGAIFSIVGIVILGVALVVIGDILFAVMVMRLAEIEGLDRGFRIAGALYIASVVLSFVPYIGVAGYAIGLVSTFLIYTYSKNSLESFKGGKKEGEEGS